MPEWESAMMTLASIVIAVPLGVGYHLGTSYGSLTLKIIDHLQSSLESKYGAAHVEEHMAFLGTKRFSKAELMAFFERSGIAAPSRETGRRVIGLSLHEAMAALLPEHGSDDHAALVDQSSTPGRLPAGRRPVPVDNPAPDIRNDLDELAAQISALDGVVTIWMSPFSGISSSTQARAEEQHGDEEEEHEEGVACVATAVFDHTGQMQLALTAIGPTVIVSPLVVPEAPVRRRIAPTRSTSSCGLNGFVR